MELKQLEYFLMVSKLKSFTLAAEQLYVSQPGVTTAIKRLEEELGIQLFIRNKKNAELTAEGRVFFNHIEIIMNDVSKAITKVTELKNLNSGTIRIGLSPITGVSVLTFLLAKFRTLYPSLNLILIEEGSLSLQKHLEENKLDLAFILLDDKSPFEMLDTLPLGKQELQIALPSYHMLKDKESLSLSSLQNECFIFFQEDCLARSLILEEFKACKLAPTISFSANSIQTIKRLIICGAGISILPSEAIENDHNFCGIPLSPPLHIIIGLAYKKNKHLSHAAETLCDFVKNSLALE
jgi:DNA-binding transcriptional LysR family regulator